MKIPRFQIVADEITETLQWRWTAFLWLRDPKAIADIAVKSLVHYPTEAICVEEAKKLLTELGLELEFKPMNKNSRQRKAANPGAHAPRKSTKPKVAASAAEITRRIAKERS